MGDERKTKDQLTAELSELRASLAEANRRISDLEAECEQMDQLLAVGKERMNQQERLAAVGQLAGGIAHDFGNFLTSNIFHIELLLNDHRLPSELRPTAETLLSGSRRTADLVRQILDFSRRTALRTQPIDLASFVGDISDILRRTLPENIHLIIEPQPGEHVANVDPARIEQVVMNLALNARDAMPDGGELRIGLHRVETNPGEGLPGTELSLATVPSGEDPGGKWLCLTVSDTGTGMTEDVRTRLFEPFFTTKGEAGTGLGLAQIYGIVTQHDGHIGVETEAGQGTTFRVYLPASDEVGAAGAVSEMAVAPRGNGETILFVEDEDKVREAGQLILESLGYQVLTAPNGREALQVYTALERADDGDATEIQLIITDVVMPEMGGLEMLKELRGMNVGVRALAITGHALGTDNEWAAAGVTGTVRKPFEVGDLAEAIRRVLDAS
jgi:signal transduction histidine kinase/ActR/RegA family two-component response regulator